MWNQIYQHAAHEGTVHTFNVHFPLFGWSGRSSSGHRTKEEQGVPAVYPWGISMVWFATWQLSGEWTGFFFHGWKSLLEIQAEGIFVGVILLHLPVLTNSILERPRHSALVQGTLCSAAVSQSMTTLPSWRPQTLVSAGSEWRNLRQKKCYL